MKNYFDSINRIFNSCNSGKKISFCKYSIFTMLILEIFYENNFIENYFLLIIKNKKFLIVFIKNIYYIKYFSKPSRKISLKNKELNNLLVNISLGIINTNIGLLTLKESKKIGISGYILMIVL